MRTVQQSLLVLGLGVLLIAGAALIFDLGFLKPVYERVGSHYLQRDVQVGGQMSVRLGRSLKVTAENVTVLGAAPTDPPLASVESAEVSLSLPALFDNLIDIESLSLVDANVRLDIDETGEGSWPTFETDDEPSDLSLRVGSAQLSEVNLFIRDADVGRNLDIAVTSLEGRTTDSTLTILLDGALNQRSVRATGTLDGVTSLLDLHQWHIDSTGQIGRASFSITGFLESLADWNSSHLEVTLHSDSANEFLRTLSMPLIDDGPIDVKAILEPKENAAHLDINAVFGEFSLIGTARSEDPSSLQAAEIQLEAKGPNLAHLGDLAAQPHWPETPFDLRIEAARAGTQIDVTTFQLDSDALLLGLSGRVADFRSLGSGQFDGTLFIPSLDVWSAVLELPPQLSGSLKGSIALIGEGNGADVLVKTESDLGSLDISGRIEPGESMLGSTLNVQGFSAQPDRLLGLFSDAPPALPALSFKGDLAIEDAELIRLKAFWLQLGEDVAQAAGTVGWGAAQHTTRVDISAQVGNLRSTLSPWISDDAAIPLLPAAIEGAFTYPAPLELSIDGGRLTIDEATGRFTGKVNLSAESASVAGDWQLNVPSMKPLLTQIELPAHLDKPITYDGRAKWQQERIDLIDGELTYGPSTISGDLRADLNQFTVQFDLRSNTPDLIDYAPDTAVTAPALSIPMEVRASGELTSSVWSVKTLRVESAQTLITGSGFLELEGQEFANSHFNGQFDTASLAVFGDLLGHPLPEEDLHITLDVDSRAGALVVDQFDVSSGNTDLSITGQAINPSAPAVSLAMSSQRIDLTPWLPRDDAASDATEEGQEDTVSSADKRQRLIPDYPLHWAQLDAFQADASIKIGELIGLPRPVLAVDILASMGRDGIRIEKAEAANERGGISTLTAELVDDPDGVPTFSLRIDGTDLVLGIPKAPSEDINTLPPYYIKLRLNGSGHSSRELAASLDGYLNVTMSEGKVLNAGLDRITNSFLQELSDALNPFQEQQESTNINCGAVFATVNSGKVSGKPAVVVDTPNVKIFADAAADLSTEKIQLQFKTVPQKGLGFSMSSLINPYIEVTGTLADPRLSLNPGNTVVAGGLAYVTGGISILIRNVLDRMSTSGNVCAARLKEANEEMSQMDASG